MANPTDRDPSGGRGALRVSVPSGPNAGAARPAERPSSAPKPTDAASKTRDLLNSIPKLELPKGGGAVRGIGEKFQANPVTGTAGFTVPVATSPARNGFGPSLTLSYDSGAGNGPFGLGWSMEVPRIQRKTDRGLPRYRDAVDGDGFVLSDAEDLVPFQVWTGTDWEEPALPNAEEGSDSWKRRRYRPRMEGAFARIERWTHTSTRAVHWRTWSPQNVCRIYGLSGDARLADPDDGSRVFAWYLQEERDEVGNLIRYSYTAEDRVGAVFSAAEGMRALAGNGCTYLYLKRIFYGNVTPFSDSGGWLFEVVLDYGDHSGEPTDTPVTAPASEPDQTWPVRDDVVSSFRSGFDIRCYRLCRRILMFHRFGDPTGTTEDPVLVRSTELTHAASGVATTVTSVTVRGWKYEASVWTTETMPAVSFTYTTATTDTSAQLVTGLDDLPNGVDTANWLWADLDGEGLTGLLTERGGDWFYKRNEGEGALGAIRRVSEKGHMARLGTNRLADVDGDGRLEILSLRPGAMGYVTRNADGSWRGFRHFPKVPNLPWSSPDLRQLDLDGDGLADVLIAGDDCFVCVPGEGSEGWGEWERRRKPADERLGPRMLFSNPHEAILLADLNGDGLTDLVRVRNGSVCYWPNRGYGRFGARVVMGREVWFDAADRFDARRVRLADVDGSGPADLIYLGPDRVRVWLNQSGNRWSAPTELTQLPGVEQPDAYSVADLRGDGTACLVWSSRLLRDAGQSLKYLPLMGSGKPYLLKTMDNGLGRVTTLGYRSSTSFYTEDRRAGAPWATRLPFPVHCLETVEVRDEVTGWRNTTRYAYHHGYHDSAEREFRGFGKVEQWDTEQLGTYASEARGDEAALDLPPVRTVSWFHTGAWQQQGTLEDAYAAEYWAGDEDLATAEASAPGTTWPVQSSTADAEAGWPARDPIEQRQAARALRGKLLRQEVYAEDGIEGVSEHPYVVTASSYTVIRLQASVPAPSPRSGGGLGWGRPRHPPPAVFLVVPRESLARHYERVTDDPRTQHTLTLAYDAYGTVTEQATVSYPRRDVTGRTDEQNVLTVVVAKTGVIHNTANLDTETDPDAMFWHVAVPWRATVWEITHDDWTERTGGLAAPTDLAPFTVAQLAEVVGDATEIAFEETASTGLQKRCLTETRTLYQADDLTGPVAAGGMGSRALVYQKYQRAFTAGLLDDVYDTDVDSTDLENAGYVDLDEDGAWWAQSGTQTLDPDHFYVATAYTDAFGNTTDVSWDEWFYQPISVEDPLGNTVDVSPDLVALQPSLVTDPNGNRTFAVYDPLGRLTAVAVQGKEGDSDGDTLEAPTITYTYDLHRWLDDGLPARVHVQARTEHGGSEFLDRYTYSDGGGNVVQEKVSAEPGLVGEEEADPRWLGTGRTVLNNKGLPVKQFEPFFSSTEACEFEDEMVAQGVSSTIFYDPVGRATRVALPNGTLRRMSFTPWEQTHEDENDTVLGTTWYSTRHALDLSDPERQAAEKAAAHNDTPTTVHLDSQGRPYQTDEIPETGTTYTTIFTLDVLGNPTAVTDARGNPTQTEVFDQLGRPMKAISPDAGDTTALLDVAGQPVIVLKSGDLRIERAYDALRRPTTLTVKEGASAPTIREVVEYGEAATSPEVSNLKGRPWRQWDTAGRVSFDGYDFKGNLLTSARRFWDRVGTGTDVVTWASTPDDGDLESDTDLWLTTSQTYDALNRVRTQTAPDGTVTEVIYNEAGLLEAVTVDDEDFVTAVAYNARGQREAITYGNEVSTAHTYDPQTFRLKTLATTRASDDADLQTLEYWYDPVGNITRIDDTGDLGGTLYFANGAVSANQGFVYDAVYRLTEATGRERASLGFVAPGDEPAYGSRPDANTAVQRYTQSYTYDEVGNIEEMDHFVASSSPYNWTRTYDYASDSNRLESTTVASITDTFAHDIRGSIVYLPHMRFSSTQAPNITTNFRDQMVRVELPTTGQYALYWYDAGGQRVRKVVVKGAVVEERRYVGGFEVWTKTTSGTLDERRTTLHVMDGQQRIAMIEAKTNGTTWTRVRYQLGNHLGTACLELDEDGEIISYEEYHPYGTTAWRAPELSEVSAKRYRYTGMERDEETGLQCHGVRYYAVWLGRWMSSDPIGLGGGVNRFAYARAHPIHRRDPSGLRDVGAEYEAREQLRPRPPVASPAAPATGPPIGVVLSTTGQLGLSLAASVPNPLVAVPAEIAGIAIDISEAKADIASFVEQPSWLGGALASASVAGVALDLVPGGAADAPAEVLQGTLRAAGAGTPAVVAGSGLRALPAKGTGPASIGGAASPGATVDGSVSAASGNVSAGTGAFLADTTGGEGLGKLAGKSVTVSPKGLSLVEGHLAQFGDVPANTAMLGRLREAQETGTRIAGADASFYLHEASEATMMGRGVEYEAAHAAALGKYGVSPYSVYAPEVIEALPGDFNSNWRAFWGME